MNLYDDTDEVDAPAFGINAGYAEAFEKKKRTEELSKLQDKYGADYHLSDEESDEDLSDEDSDAELVTPEVDVAILRTLARIRQKDPLVYEDGRQVFDEEEQRTASTSGPTKAKATKTKPVLLKDYQRSRLIADPTASLPDTVSAAGFLPTFAQEESALRAETTKAFHGVDSDDESEGEDLLQPREKTKDEREKEDEEYQKFLKENVGDREVEDALEQEEKFLRDYILNRGWIDRSGNKSRIPSYNEITGSPPPSASASGSNAAPPKEKKVKKAAVVEEGAEEEKDLDVGQNDSEDSEYEERADDFENKYNFRFEEEAGPTILTHSRVLASSTARKATTVVTARARARDAAKEKKDAEKLERREEVRRMKALKRKEVEEKLLKLLEVAGEGTTGLDGIDLEGDWDPEEHDRKMAEIYGEEYGGVTEDPEFKPVWDDDIDISDLQALEDGASGDEAYDPSAAVVKAKKDKKGKRKRDDEGFPTALMEAAQRGGDKERAALLESMVDDYYGLDYEDKIGELSTRFKYAKVAASSFALTPSEILLATDTELNSYISLRKMAPYRADEDKKGKSKKRLKELRDSIKDRKWGVEVDEVDAAEVGREKKKVKKWSEETGRTKEGEEKVAGVKRVGKKERERRKKAAAAEEGAASVEATVDLGGGQVSRRSFGKGRQGGPFVYFAHASPLPNDFPHIPLSSPLQPHDIPPMFNSMINKSGRRVVEKMVQRSVMRLTSGSIVMGADGTTTLTSEGSLLQAGAFDVDVEFPTGVEVFWRGTLISHIYPPSLHSIGSIGIPALHLSSEAIIDDLTTFREFARYVSEDEEGAFEWEFKADDCVVKALGARFDALVFSKVVPLDGPFLGIKEWLAEDAARSGL